MTKLSPDLSYLQARSAQGLPGVARLAATRAFYCRQSRWLKRRTVNALSRVLVDLLFRLALLTADEPEFKRLHRQVCAAIEGAQMAADPEQEGR